jgi:hypothetical protein
MQLHNRVLTALSALYLIALAITPSSSAMERQTNYDQTLSAGLQEPQQPSTPKSTVFTGTIVKSGSDYLLKDASGNVYMLDTPEKAKYFEGKNVKVTGRLEANANLLHVEAIEELSA